MWGGDRIFEEDNKPKYQMLNQSIKRGDLLEVKSIIDSLNRGEVINECDKNMQTSIFYAATNDNEQFCLKVTQLLLEKGADPFHKDVNKQTVLYYLAKLGKARLLEKYMEFSFNLNENDYIKQTPIFFAAVNNHKKVAQILIRENADVNHKDYNNQTCLFYAAREGHLQMCRILINNGCNALHQDNGKKTAIHFAKANHRRQVVDYLSNLKNQVRRKQKQREQKKYLGNSFQQSSQNDQKSKKKKQLLKFEYCLVYTNEQGHIHELTPQQLKKFCQTSQQYNKLYDLMKNPEKLENQPLPQDKKFQKIATKIIQHFWKLENGIHFHEPVDWAKMGLKDYPEIVKHPMDFGTIKTKLAFNAYHDYQQFKNDMNLVFDNCILYNGRQSAYGKIAFQLKLQFINMYNRDLPNIN